MAVGDVRIAIKNPMTNGEKQYAIYLIKRSYTRLKTFRSRLLENKLNYER